MAALPGDPVHADGGRQAERSQGDVPRAARVRPSPPSQGWKERAGGAYRWVMRIAAVAPAVLAIVLMGNRWHI